MNEARLEVQIKALEQKINAMRSLLWEWNCTAVPVWEIEELFDLGETRHDYLQFMDTDDLSEEECAAMYGEDGATPTKEGSD